MDDKIEIKNVTPFDIKLSGLRWTVVAFAVASMAISMADLSNAIKDISAEKKVQSDIMRKQIETAQKQYTLDSLRFYNQNQK